jgi:hypothetical protein
MSTARAIGSFSLVALRVVLFLYCQFLFVLLAWALVRFSLVTLTDSALAAIPLPAFLCCLLGYVGLWRGWRKLEKLGISSLQLDLVLLGAGFLGIVALLPILSLGAINDSFELLDTLLAFYFAPVLLGTHDFLRRWRRLHSLSSTPLDGLRPYLVGATALVILLPLLLVGLHGIVGV